MVRGPVTGRAVAVGRESALPEEDYQRALQAARGCDLMVVLGSSLRITPACDLPAEALAHGGKLAIINLQRTQLDQVPLTHPRESERRRFGLYGCWGIAARTYPWGSLGANSAWL